MDVTEKASDALGQAQEAQAKAQGRAREEIGRRTTEAGDQLGAVAEAIRSSGKELRNQGKTGPAQLVERAAEQADRLGGYLRDADSDRILGDVEDFGRRRPWVAGMAGAAAGLLAARFLKASSSRRYRERQTGLDRDAETIVGRGDGYPHTPAPPVLPERPVEPEATGSPSFQRR